MPLSTILLQGGLLKFYIFLKASMSNISGVFLIIIVGVEESIVNAVYRVATKI
jgi:hypothetical protein